MRRAPVARVPALNITFFVLRWNVAFRGSHPNTLLENGGLVFTSVNVPNL